jgi:peptide chain release factor 1
MSRLPLDDIIDRYNALSQELSQTTETDKLIALSKKQKPLFEQYELSNRIKTIEKTLADNQAMLEDLDSSDAELAELTREENKTLEEELEQKEDALLSYLSPSDPRDDHDIYLEIRAGAGGDESSLFAGDLAKAYSLLCQNLGFKFSIISSSTNDLGGYKEVIVEIKGSGAFSWFKYERGVHRVQRVPSTEKQGRIHTSTVAVAVMPIVEQTDDFKLNMDDVEIIATTSSGKGGQSVNTTYSAIKVKHLPTGIEAQSQDERNQLQNKDKALTVLASRVFDHYEQERLDKEASERKEQVGRMDRSEKIRTYNYPQDRVTDHRYNKSWNQLPGIMSGDIQQVIIDIKKIEAETILQKLSSS